MSADHSREFDLLLYRARVTDLNRIKNDPDGRAHYDSHVAEDQYRQTALCMWPISSGRNASSVTPVANQLQSDAAAATGTAIPVPEPFKVDRSLAGRLCRRTLFFVRYSMAQMQSRTVGKLLPIVEDSFDHPWVSRIEFRIRSRPGNGALSSDLRSNQVLPAGLVHWDAPVTICVFRRRRGKDRPALCMSLYVNGGTVNIVQLQGVLHTDPPKEIRLWPRTFIESCRTFVRQEHLKAVKVAKADSLYSYRNPYVNPELPLEAREEAVQRIRKSIELIYDVNALALGFIPDGDWFKWENSKPRALGHS